MNNIFETTKTGFKKTNILNGTWSFATQGQASHSDKSISSVYRYYDYGASDDYATAQKNIDLLKNSVCSFNYSYVVTYRSGTPYATALCALIIYDCIKISTDGSTVSVAQLNTSNSWESIASYSASSAAVNTVNVNVSEISKSHAKISVNGITQIMNFNIKNPSNNMYFLSQTSGIYNGSHFTVGSTVYLPENITIFVP